MAEGAKNEKIRVEDRRHFDKNGNPVERKEARLEEDSEKKRTEQHAPAPESQEETIDFITVLFSYVHTALIHLGEVPDPLQKTTSENLPGAKQMIEILELMQDKTKGNLEEHEKEYLSGALFDLRMRYMKKAKLIK